MQHLLAVDVLGQRQLDQYAVNRGVGIETIDGRQELGLRGFGRQPNGDGVHAGLLARLPLGPDIHGAGGIFAHQHGGESRLAAVTAQPRHLGSHLPSNRPGDRGPVEDPGTHRAKSTARVSRITTTLI